MSRYARNAAITLDWVLGITQERLAARYCMSPQRVHQIIQKTLGNVGMANLRREEISTTILGYRLRAKDPDTGMGSSYDRETPKGMFFELIHERSNEDFTRR